jgi:hypothetical protein
VSDITDIIGRDRLDDVAAILAVANPDRDAVFHEVPVDAAARFTWDYQRSSGALDRLYEKAKVSQWNVSTDLDWSVEVDLEKVVAEMIAAQGGIALRKLDLSGTSFERWGEKEWLELGCESQSWTLSQFLHGEQGALLCSARIVEIVPDIEAKLYASTQVVDEARHVEVFAKYLDEKLDGHYQVNAHLQALLDDILSDSRWDMTYLGMQVMVEGLALAAFGFMRQMTTEPLLQELLRYVMADEARHVAFGVLALKGFYDDLSLAEVRERQEFAFEAAVRMRDRFLQQEVYERLDVDPAEGLRLALSDPNRLLFQSMLFSKIVPNCSKLGLLDAGDGWLRDRFTDMGVIGFEQLDATDDEVFLEATAV